MKKKSDVYNRLQEVLLVDKSVGIKDSLEVIKCDIYAVLGNYFTMIDKAISIDIKVDNEGIYSIQIDAKADNIIPLKKVQELK